MPALRVVRQTIEIFYPADNNNMADLHKSQVRSRINPPVDQSLPRIGHKRRFSISLIMMHKARMDILEGIQATLMLSREYHTPSHISPSSHCTRLRAFMNMPRAISYNASPITLPITLSILYPDFTCARAILLIVTYSPLPSYFTIL